MSKDKSAISYKDSGVDIDKAATLVDKISALASAIGSSKSQGLVGGIGGFASLYEVPPNMHNPVLATATDGVGTKLELAKDAQDYHCLGIDLVAMCVNDLICSGATPQVFLDYYATGVLDEEQAAAVISGICEGCKQADCVLAGGETAEMPGLYPAGKFDLAGFAVGLVEKQDIIGPQQMAAEYQEGVEFNLVGLRSAGVHANGFSLVRKLLETKRLNVDAKELMKPTRIYVRALLNAIKRLKVIGAAHITGGGLTENLPRAFPSDWTAKLDKQKIFAADDIFSKLQEASGMDDEELLKTFNCGIGMVIIHPQEETAKLLQSLKQDGEEALLIGSLYKSQKHKLQKHQGESKNTDPHNNSRVIYV